MDSPVVELTLKYWDNFAAGKESKPLNAFMVNISTVRENAS